MRSSVDRRRFGHNGAPLAAFPANVEKKIWRRITFDPRGLASSYPGRKGRVGRLRRSMGGMFADLSTDSPNEDLG